MRVTARKHLFLFFVLILRGWGIVMEPTYKSYVLELLKNSSHRLRQIEIMRYELQHIPQISDSEIIEAMSLPSLTSSEKASNSKAVPDVALSYKQTAERMNAEALCELASAYPSLAGTQHLQHYSKLLCTFGHSLQDLSRRGNGKHVDLSTPMDGLPGQSSIHRWQAAL